MQGVRRADVDSVDRLVGEDLTKIADRFDGGETEVADELDRGIEGGLVDVADGDDLEAGKLGAVADILGAHAADADEGDVDLVVGGARGGRGEGGGTGGLQERAPTGGLVGHANSCSRLRSIGFRVGDVVLILPDLAHAYGPKSGGGWTHLYIVFSGFQFDLWRRRSLLDPERPVWRAEPVDFWARRLEETVLPDEGHGPAASLRALGRFIDVLAALVALTPQFEKVAADLEIPVVLADLLANHLHAARGPLQPQPPHVSLHGLAHHPAENPMKMKWRKVRDVRQFIERKRGVQTALDVEQHQPDALAIRVRRTGLHVYESSRIGQPCLDCSCENTPVASGAPRKAPHSPVEDPSRNGHCLSLATPYPARPRAPFPANLVEVPVVVRDGRRRPVAGFTRDDSTAGGRPLPGVH